MTDLAADPGEWTPDQITRLIAEAVKARDLKAVPHLIALLALRDPHQAEVVRESMLAVLREQRRAFRASLRTGGGND